MRSRPVSRVLSKLALRDSHSSGTVVTHSLEQPTREQRGPRYRSPIWSCTGWGLPCRPCYHVRGGLLPAARYVAPPPRCCRETPFHPCLIPCGPSAVCSLLHFPSPHGARPLAGILPCGARTFLPARKVRSDCPADFAESIIRAWREIRESIHQPRVARITKGAGYTSWSCRILRSRTPHRCSPPPNDLPPNPSAAMRG